MKMRRTVIAIFLMVAIMTLGIGYAALSDEFTITANVQTPAFDPKVDFTDYSITSGVRNGVTVANVATDDETNDDYAITVTGLAESNADTLTLGVDGFLATVGDKIIVTFTIENKSDFAVTLKDAVVTSTNGTVFSTTAALSTNSLSAKNGTSTLTVTIEMISEVPSTDESATDTFTITVETDTVG